MFFLVKLVADNVLYGERMETSNKRYIDFIRHNDYALLNIAHNLTSIQQKSWHYMLLFAAKEICKRDEHKISLARLVNFLNVKSAYEIKAKILEMGKPEKPDGFSYYFEKINIIDDTVFYSYPEHLRILLSHPYIWDVSKKTISYNFQSKYSLFLYEFLLFYDLFGATHVFALGALRHYFGFASYQYADVKTLYRSVLTQAFCEINNKTPLTVSMKYEKEGAVVVGFKISITKKNVHMKELGDENFCPLYNGKEMYGLFLQNAAYSRYYRLSPHAREKIDLMYEPWVQQHHPQVNSNDLFFLGVIKKLFLVEHCLASYEQDYDLWLGQGGI